MSVIRVKSASIMRKDTAQNWVDKNPTLREGEEGYETDTRKRKVGDGVTAWSSLPYDDAVVTAALVNVGALTLIDSVTLTEAVAFYSKTLPVNTYREIYAVATIKLGGTVNNNQVMFSATEYQSGYRVCAVSDAFTAGNTVYVSAQLLRLPSRGTCGIISCSKIGYFNAKTSMTPGLGDTASATEFLSGCYLSVAPQYTENTVLMDVGTKIQLWGR